MNRKTTVLAIALAVLLIVLLTATSLAFTTVEKKTRSEVASGAIDVELVVTDKDGKAVDDLFTETILPGKTVEKTLKVKNAEDHAAWVRVKLNISVDDEALSAEDSMTIDINTKDWTEKDGWYYYNEKLEPGKETEPLFTEVHFEGERMNNDYRGKSFTLNMITKAVQSENNGSTVFEAVGWPAD